MHSLVLKIEHSTNNFLEIQNDQKATLEGMYIYFCVKSLVNRLTFIFLEMQKDQKVALGGTWLTALEIDALSPNAKIIAEQQKESLRQSRIWLGGIGRDFEFEKNRKLHTAGTCEWILNNDLFNSWIVGEVDILLISGIPGKFTISFPLPYFM